MMSSRTSLLRVASSVPMRTAPLQRALSTSRLLRNSAPASTTNNSSSSSSSTSSSMPKVNASSTTAMEFKQQHPRQLRRLPRVDTSGLKASAAEQAVSNLLYNTPISPKLQSERHVLDCLAQDEPGVLSRVTGIMAARGFNIDTLVASKTEVPGLSRMTLVLKGPAIVMEQAKKQLEDLVPIWAVLDYSRTRVIERESLLVKVSIAAQDNGEPADAGAERVFFESQGRLQALKQLAELFQGQVLDVGERTAVVSMNAKSERVDAFLKLVRPFGILEAVRSGIMAMPRSGDATLFESERNATRTALEDMDMPDLSNLPPS